MSRKNVLAAVTLFTLLDFICTPKFTPPDRRECISVTDLRQPVITYNANAASTIIKDTQYGVRTQYFDLVHEQSLSVIGLNDPTLYTCYRIK